jgi:amino acid transporter
MSLALINVAAVISLRNLPAIADYGWTSIFVYGVSIVLFMIPISYAAAELASGWARNGGVWLWVRQALGEHWGLRGGC